MPVIFSANFKTAIDNRNTMLIPVVRFNKPNDFDGDSLLVSTTDRPLGIDAYVHPLL